MSFEAVSWAFKQNIKRATEKLCLIALANYANSDRRCFPSIDTLVNVTGQNRKTIIKSLKNLEIGFFIRDTKIRIGKTKSIPVYELLCDETPKFYYYVYKTTNPETGEYYYGVRKSEVFPEVDSYVGSGKWINDSLNKGAALVKEILHTFDTFEDARAAESKILKNLKNEDGLNRNGNSAHHLRVMAKNKSKFVDFSALSNAENGIAYLSSNTENGTSSSSTKKGTVESGSSTVFTPKQYQKRDTEYNRNNTDTSYLSDPLEDFLKTGAPNPQPCQVSTPEVPPFDPVKFFWDEAVKKLRNMAVPDQKSRKMIGKWLRDSGDDKDRVMAAIDEAVAKGTMEPVSFVTKILDKKTFTPHKEQKRKEVSDVIERLKVKGAERRAQWETDAGGGDGGDPVSVPDGPAAESGEVHLNGGKRSRRVQTGDAGGTGGSDEGHHFQVEVPAVDSGFDF